jgi:hypothetical protein
MVIRHPDGPSEPLVTSKQTAERLWCETCDTDSFLFIEAVRCRHFTPPGYLEVSYFCSQCDGFYGRLIAEADVKPEFLAPVALGKLRHGNAPTDETR